MTEKPEYLLEVAKSVIDGAREEDYGSKQVNFERISEFWTTYLKNKDFLGGYHLTVRDIGALFILGKLARIAHSEDHSDSWIDLLGYGEIVGSKVVSDDGKTILEIYLEDLE